MSEVEESYKRVKVKFHSHLETLFLAEQQIENKIKELESLLASSHTPVNTFF